MTNQSDLEDIRGYIDGSETFMTGHDVRSTRGKATLKKVTPAWTKSDIKIQGVLLRVFPKLLTNEKQRRRAAVWARVIYLYYRMGFTYGQIAEEMGILSKNPRRPYRALEGIIQSISRASRGLNCRNGKPRAQRGRPKKKSCGKPRPS